MKIANRAQVAPFYVMQALTEAEKLSAEGADIMHLSLGQPCARPPETVLTKVAARAMAAKRATTRTVPSRPAVPRSRSVRVLITRPPPVAPGSSDARSSATSA